MSSVLRLALLPALVGALLISACGNAPGGESPLAPADPEPAGPQLAGRAFVATEAKGLMLPPGGAVRIEFGQGRISANAGCNTLTGPADWSQGRLMIEGGKLSSTLLGCPHRFQRLDNRLHDFLVSQPTLELDGATLRLTGSSLSIELQEERARPLRGTSWQLTSLVGDELASSLPTGVTAGLTIAAGGATIGVRTGCNQAGSDITLQPDDPAATEGRIAIEGLIATEKACAEDVMAVERHMFEVLDGEVAYRIDGRTLTLTNGDRGLVLTAGPVGEG